MPATVLTRKGQMTVPAEARRKLGLKEGDRLEVTVEGDRLVVRRALSIVAMTAGAIRTDRHFTRRETEEARDLGLFEKHQRILRGE